MKRKFYYNIYYYNMCYFKVNKIVFLISSLYVLIFSGCAGGGANRRNISKNDIINDDLIKKISYELKIENPKLLQIAEEELVKHKGEQLKVYLKQKMDLRGRALQSPEITEMKSYINYILQKKLFSEQKSYYPYGKLRSYWLIY